MQHFLYKLTVRTITNDSYQQQTHVCLLFLFFIVVLLLLLSVHIRNINKVKYIKISHFVDFFECYLKAIFAKILGWLVV